MVTDAMVEAAREVLPFGLDVRVVRSALEAAEAAAWQPIETLPEFGFALGKYATKYENFYMCIYRLKGVIFDDSGEAAPLITHWRSLPGIRL